MVRQRLRRIVGPPEGDTSLIAYRIVTAGVVVTSVTAAVTQQAVVGTAGVAALVLVPVGFVFSYIRRSKRNILLKVFLTVGLFAAFAGFLDGVRGAQNVDDTRIPLVAVFLWVQVLHSFDVPRARDLTFSVAAGVALIALAGSLAFTTGFIVLVLIFAAFFLAALVLGHQADLRVGADGPLAREVTQRTTAPGSARRFPLLRPVAGLIAGTFFCTATVFVFLPRFGGTQFAALPFSIVQRTPIAGFAGEVVNPGSSDGSEGSEAGFDASAYFGYGDSLDLHVRGTLADDLVMRVRSPRPGMYRGQIYDVYEDGKWTSSDTEMDELRSGGLGSLSVPSGIEDPPRRVGRELVQTFYVERELPNIVFHTYQAEEVYISSTRALVDDFASVRLPFTLEQDTIYSVISRVPAYSADTLRGAPSIEQMSHIPSRDALDRYLQLPATLRGRFRDLALKVTDGYPTTFDKANAIDRWLSDNKRYRLDISRDPPGRDPVDFFVFDRDEGFCEQIASTMVLMLRASGVPARIVTGFGPGQRNLFTGYWEVLNSDAHAWVEAFYPGYGWITYDPTFGVPSSAIGDTTFMLAPLRRVAGDLFAFDAIRDLASKAVRAIRAAPVVGAVVIGLVLATLISLTRWGISVVRPRARGPGPTVAAWLEIERALGRRGYARVDNETALEFARRVRPHLADLGPFFEEAAEAFGEVRYGVRPQARREEWAIRAVETARTIKTHR